MLRLGVTRLGGNVTELQSKISGKALSGMRQGVLCAILEMHQREFVSVSGATLEQMAAELKLIPFQRRFCITVYGTAVDSKTYAVHTTVVPTEDSLIFRQRVFEPDVDTCAIVNAERIIVFQDTSGKVGRVGHRMFARF